VVAKLEEGIICLPGPAVGKYRQAIVVTPNDQMLGEAVVELLPSADESLLYFLSSHRTDSFTPLSGGQNRKASCPP